MIRNLFLPAMLFLLALLAFSCNKNSENLDAQIAKLENALQEIQSKLNKQNDGEELDLLSLEKKLSTLRTELRKLKGEDAQNTNFTSVEQKLSNLSSQLDIIKGVGTDAPELIDINAQLSEIHTAIDSLQTALTEHSVDKLSEKIEELKTKVAILQKTRTLEQTNLDDIQSRLNDLEKSIIPQSQGTHQGHTYVDLGLSVMWATCNVGASSPEDFGYYYAWGELKGCDKNGIGEKTEFTYYNYKWNTWDKKYDSPSILELEDVGDIASFSWKGSWRIPTKEQAEELLKCCTSELTEQNGVKGRTFTSKKNGNSIFLPCVDSFNNTFMPDSYWTKTKDLYLFDSLKISFCLSIKNIYGIAPCDCTYGLPIRPVCKK